MTKRYGHLVEKIISRDNMEAAFDEVVDKLNYGVFFWNPKECSKSKPKKDRRAKYRAQRESIITSLIQEISTGTFRIRHYDEFWVKDGPKIRLIQSPDVYSRIGCNAIMRVVEEVLYPSLIKTSGASIKGRGMHKLFRKMQSDIRNDRKGTAVYYACDISKYYDNIRQDLVIVILKRKIKDPILLPILIHFVRLLPKGLSIGLRSSQCYGNLMLNDVDHSMKEKWHCRYYYRYCDDRRILSSSKKKLWKWRNIFKQEVEKRGLKIKRDEAVRPITEGLDFLGYIEYGDHARLRKRTKQKAARALKRVTSRKRRRELIGSFKGMAKWGNCKNLYYVLTEQKMDEEFGSLGLQYVPSDGKKRFNGKGVAQRTLINLRIKLLDFEEDIKTQNGKRTLVQFLYEDGKMEKYFTEDKEQLYFLKKLKEIGKLGSVWTTIKPEPFGNGKGIKYIFT